MLDDSDAYQSAFLVFHGIDTIAEATLNGRKLVPSPSNMFVRYCYDVKRLLKKVIHVIDEMYCVYCFYRMAASFILPTNFNIKLERERFGDHLLVADPRGQAYCISARSHSTRMSTVAVQRRMPCEFSAKDAGELQLGLGPCCALDGHLVCCTIRLRSQSVLISSNQTGNQSHSKYMMAFSYAM